jgi:hypothetical protein
MLKFVDFSNYDADVYLVVDGDVLYYWYVSTYTNRAKYWLENREKYDFKLEIEGDITSIAVYDGNMCVFCEEITKVTYL